MNQCKAITLILGALFCSVQAFAQIEDERYSELVDNGNDPFVAGCIARYDNPYDCTNYPDQPAAIIPDVCHNTIILHEGTVTQSCSQFSDTDYDCDLLCKGLGADYGLCMMLRYYCPTQKDSARCRCFNIHIPIEP